MVRVSIGDYALGFTLESVNMGTVSLSSYKGEWVVIIFGRYFGCPVCQLEFDDLLEYKDRIREYANIVYLTQSSPESALSYIKDYDVDFLVVTVSKEDGYGVYRDYGVGNFGMGTTIEILKKASKARKMGKVHGAYEGHET